MEKVAGKRGVLGEASAEQRLKSESKCNAKRGRKGGIVQSMFLGVGLDEARLTAAGVVKGKET